MDLLFDWMAVFLIIALGVMIKYLKMHRLIAGYAIINFISPDKTRELYGELMEQHLNQSREQGGL